LPSLDFCDKIKSPAGGDIFPFSGNPTLPFARTGWLSLWMDAFGTDASSIPKDQEAISYTGRTSWQEIVAGIAL
jgi:hypothetical protein